MAEPAILVQNLWKKFRRGELHDSLREFLPALARRLLGRATPEDQLGSREFWALRDISFQLDHGQSLGIIGPNGAGKSTLLKILSRILKPNRGSYQVHGRLSSLIELGAGFHPDLTGRENIYLSGIIRGMTRREVRAREQDIIAFAELQDFIDTPVKRYSSGMLARLGFSVAAHMNPDILLIDEVLSVGDARFRDKCLRHMHQLLRSGITVVFISHILDQVRSLCPRTIVLDRGQVVFDGPTDAAIRLYLDLLSSAAPASAAPVGPVELRNLRFEDAAGQPVTQWQPGQPAAISFDLLLHQPLEGLSLLVNLHTISGVYLATLSTRRAGFVLPTQPGLYRLRLHLDSLPLDVGDYVFDMKVNQLLGSSVRTLWLGQLGGVISVRGRDEPAGPLLLQGRWELLSSDASALPPPCSFSAQP